jgi:DNA invertase Pin-like site-specific DNA recombinase
LCIRENDYGKIGKNLRRVLTGSFLFAIYRKKYNVLYRKEDIEMSKEIKEKIRDLYDEGLSTAEIAEKLHISEYKVVKVLGDECNERRY